MYTTPVTLVIRHPPAEVFAAAADPERQLEWDAGNLLSVEKLTRGPLGLGARYRGRARGLGVFEYEFVEFEPGRRFAHRAALPFGEIRHVFRLESVPGGTELRQEAFIVPSLLGRALAPLLRATLRRRFRVIAEEVARYLDDTAPGHR